MLEPLLQVGPVSSEDSVCDRFGVSGLGWSCVQRQYFFEIKILNFSISEHLLASHLDGSSRISGLLLETIRPALLHASWAR